MPCVGNIKFLYLVGMALGWDVLCARLAGLNGVVAAYVAFSVTALIQTMLYGW